MFDSTALNIKASSTLLVKQREKGCWQISVLESHSSLSIDALGFFARQVIGAAEADRRRAIKGVLSGV